MDGAIFIAEDLANQNIMGRYYLEGGSIDLWQDESQFVDLNADLFITDGDFRVHGGMAEYSEWALTRAITVMMEGGVLDFMDCGIRLGNSGYNLNDIISGGTIRTSGGFICQRPGFNPIQNVLELYGPGEAVFACASPSKPNKLLINKASREGDDRSRINQVTVTSTSAISSGCTILSGIFKINDNVEFKAGGFMQVNGTLQMNTANAVVDVYGGTSFMEGSTANLTAGTLKMHNTLYIATGANFNLPAAFNCVFQNGADPGTHIYTSPNSQFGTLVWEVSSNLILGTYPLVLSGDLVIKPNSAITVPGPITVGGKIDIWHQAAFNLAAAFPVSTTHLYNSGLLNLPNSCTATLTVSGTFLQYSTGQLALHGGSLIIDTAYSGSLYSFGGTSNMSAGILQISNNGMQIGTTAFTFSGGTIKLGWSFAANNAGTFSSNSGTLEFIGSRASTLSLAEGNWLPGLKISKTESTGSVSLSSDVIIKVNLWVNSGKLQVNHHVLTVEKDIHIVSGQLYCSNSNREIRIGGIWKNYYSLDNFVEGSGLVTFITSSNPMRVDSHESFHNLKLETDWRTVTINPSLIVTVSGNLDITSGKLKPLDGTLLDIMGNFTLAGAASHIDQHFNRVTASTTIHVHGNCIINGGLISSISVDEIDPMDTIIIDGDLTMTGGYIYTLDVDMSVHGNFSTTSTTILSTRGGIFLNDAPYDNSSQVINCAWETPGNIIEFTHKGLQFVSGAILSNNFYTVIRTGRGLEALTNGLLDYEYCTYEFIGSAPASINLGGNNFLPSVVINKPGASVVLSSNVVIKYDLKILNGNLNSNGYTINLEGSWINNIGTSGYTCGTSEVIMNTTYSDKAITGNQTFHKLTFAQSSTPRTINFDNVGASILTDLTIQSGYVSINANSDIQVNGAVTIAEGAALSLGGTLRIKGNFVDQNPVQNTTHGFYSWDQAILYFNGSTTQALVFNRDAISLGGFTLDKPGGAFQPSKPINCTGDLRILDGTWGYGVSGLAHTVGGDFYVGSSGSWGDNTGELCFTSFQPGTIEILGSATLKNIRVDKFTPSHNPGTLTMQSNLSLGTTGYVTIDCGTLNIGPHTFQTRGEINVNDDAILRVGPGGFLKVTSGGSLDVNADGTLHVEGSESSPATITHTTGNYELTINSGGTIKARYAVFEYMNTNGVQIHPEAMVDTNLGFTACTFQNGQAGGTLLKLENAQALEILQASFPTSTGSYNVTKLNDQGSVSFLEETGAFIGSAYENDPWGRINWSNEVPQIIALPAIFDFGSITWSQSSDPQFLIVNNPGNGILQATLTAPEGFWVEIARTDRESTLESSSSSLTDPLNRNVLNLRVYPYSSVTCRIYFRPLAPVAYTGEIIITHNVPDAEELHLSVTGTGIGPQLHIENSYPYFNIVSGQSSSQTVYADNTGTQQLSYSCWINYPFPVTENVVVAGFEDSCPPSGWYTHNFSLSAYDGLSDLRIGLVGVSAHGQNIYIDELKVTALRSLPPDWITVNGASFSSGIIEPTDPADPLVIDVNSAGVPQGTYSAGLAFMSNDPAYPMTTLGMVINVGAPGCSVYPSSFSFSNSPVGYPASQTLEISNPGNLIMNGSFTLPECFRVEPFGGGSPLTNFSVDPGMTELFNLVFEPALAQNYSSNLVISYLGGSDVYVPLSGSGVDYPVLSTAEVTNIGYTTATGGGNVSPSGNLPILERGICWYTDQNPTLDQYHGSAAGDLGEYSVPMTDLLPGYTYWVRAYATNSLGTAYGNQQSFVLPSPALSPNPSPLPDFGTVALGSDSQPQILNISGTAISGTVTVYSPNGFLISLADDDNYSLMIQLEPVDYVLASTPIYVKFLPLERGSWTGDLSLQTNGLDPVLVQMSGTGAVQPVVETATVVNITPESATVNSRIVDDGSDPVSACGVCWNTSGNPTLTDSNVDAGVQTGWFDCQLSGLSSFTTYFVRSFATNIAGTVYGNQLSFVTYPLSQISIDESQLDPFGCIIIGQYSQVDTLTVSGMELVDALTITAPQGFELSLSLTGRDFAPQLLLLPVNGQVAPTQIFVRFAPQTGGNLADYLQAQSTGIDPAAAIVSGIGITTPSVVTLPALEIGSASALVTGRIDHDGWDLITANGFCYSTEPAPDLNDQVASVLASGGDLSTTLVGLTADTTYYFRAFATNNAGTAYGDELVFHTLLGHLDSPANLRVTLLDGAVRLDWDAVPGAHSYKIFCSPDPYAPDWGLPLDTTAETLFIISDPGVANFYRVIASSE